MTARFQADLPCFNFTNKFWLGDYRLWRFIKFLISKFCGEEADVHGRISDLRKVCFIFNMADVTIKYSIICLGSINKRTGIGTLSASMHWARLKPLATKMNKIMRNNLKPIRKKTKRNLIYPSTKALQVRQKHIQWSSLHIHFKLFSASRKHFRRERF